MVSSWIRNNQTEYRTTARKDSKRAIRETTVMTGENAEFLFSIVREVIAEFYGLNLQDTTFFISSNGPEVRPGASR